MLPEHQDLAETKCHQVRANDEEVGKTQRTDEDGDSSRITNAEQRKLRKGQVRAIHREAAGTMGNLVCSGRSMSQVAYIGRQVAAGDGDRAGCRRDLRRYGQPRGERGSRRIARPLALARGQLNEAARFSHGWREPALRLPTSLH